MKKTKAQITQESILERLGDKDRFQYGLAKGKPRCSGTVLSGSGWKSIRCSKTAKFMEMPIGAFADEDEGKRPFCKIHAPSQIEARQAKKQDERETAYQAKETRRRARKAEFVSRVAEVGQLKGKRFRTEAAALVNEIYAAGAAASRRRLL